MTKISIKPLHYGVQISSSKATRFVIDRNVGTCHETQALRECLEPSNPLKRIDMGLRAPSDWPNTTVIGDGSGFRVIAR